MQSAGDTSQVAGGTSQVATDWLPYVVAESVTVVTESSADEDTDVIYVDAELVQQEAGASEPGTVTAEEHETTAEETSSTTMYSPASVDPSTAPFMTAKTREPQVAVWRPT